MQRRIWTETPSGVIYPNLYVLLVTPPGVGKSQAIARAAELWRATENLFVAPNSVTRAALIDVLAKSAVKSILPSGEFQLFHGLNVAASEFGVLCPAHDLEFLNTLNDIYDCWPEFSEERRHRKGEQVQIKHPILNILGGTQPGFLSELLPEQAWSMGFTSRLILVYSAQQVKSSLFGTEHIGGLAGLKTQYQSDMELLKKDLTNITQLYGAVEWSPEAVKTFETWFAKGLQPVPTHSRLQHYNQRRVLNIFKLCMISSVSRSNDLTIQLADLQRAQDWLIQVEDRMPDIFRDMAGKSDKQVMDDLHDFMWRLYARENPPKPIHEMRIIQFLSAKVPSEKIVRLIELCERSGIMQRDRSTHQPMWASYCQGQHTGSGVMAKVVYPTWNAPTDKFCKKVPHPTAKAAIQALASFKRRSSRHKFKCNVYFCDMCKAWHWGHDVRSSQQKGRTEARPLPNR
jgi:hypothetical protein